MKIKQTLSWLQGAVVAAVVMGGGQTALAWSPAPWSFERDQEEGSNEILTEAEDAHRNRESLIEAYEILANPSNYKDSEEIKFWRAWYASELGLVDEAKKTYRRLIKDKPEESLSSKLGELSAHLFNIDSKYGKYHNALGYFLLVSEGHRGLRRAYAHLEKALDTAPNDPARLHSYGYALQKDGRLREAEAWYEDALDALESDADVDFLLPDYGGVALLARPGEYCPFARAVRKMLASRTSALRFCGIPFYEEMASLLDGYVRKHPNSARPKIFHALLLHKLGREKMARERLKEARADIWQKESRFQIDDMEVYGLALRETGRAREAEGVFVSLMLAEKENPWHYIRLACLLAEVGQAADVEKITNLADQALRLEPDREDIVDFQAEIHKTRIARSKGEERRCRQ